MRIIICLDDDLGMMFGGRRQSRDKVVCERAIALAEGHKFYITDFSEKLFRDFQGVTVDGNMLAVAGEFDVCFLENILPPEDTSSLTVFKWNRRYPGDMHFDPIAAGFSLVSSEDFVGSSHEKITVETYKK